MLIFKICLKIPIYTDMRNILYIGLSRPLCKKTSPINWFFKQKHLWQQYCDFWKKYAIGNYCHYFLSNLYQMYVLLGAEGPRIIMKQLIFLCTRVGGVVRRVTLATMSAAGTTTQEGTLTWWSRYTKIFTTSLLSNGRWIKTITHFKIKMVPWELWWNILLCV